MTVVDSTNPTHQNDAKQFTLVIGPALSITTNALPAGQVGTAYSFVVVAAGGTSPYTWAASGLPAGFAINASTGEIAGNTNTAFNGSVIVTVTDATSPTHQSANADPSRSRSAPTWPSPTRSYLPAP